MGRNFYVGYICLCLALMTGISQAVEANEDLEIEVVENGTSDGVVLDCPYTLEDGELGLTIKWYHMENPVFVYQWIPNNKPVANGILVDHLDLDYKAVDDEFHQHRALHILDVTTELAGEYYCVISTFDEEKRVPRKLVVYSRPANVQVWAEAEGDDEVKVVCEVEDVFPEPKVSLYMSAEGDDERVTLEPHVRPSWEKGFYDSRLELIVKEDALEGPTHFECEVTIPHTDVQVVNKTHYEPRPLPHFQENPYIYTQNDATNNGVHEHAGAGKHDDVMSGSETRSAVAVIVSLAFLAVWRI